MKSIKTDVCVIGAGAGGIGCVYRLIKNGVKTVVVDRYPDFGGTAVFCGVDGWEPGVSLDGLHTLLKNEMETMEQGCHVVETVPNCNLFHPENGMNWENHSFEAYPWGLSLPTGKGYEDTMKRCLFLRGNDTLKRLQFEGEAMQKAVHRVFRPYQDNLTAYFGFSFENCTVNQDRLESVMISNGEEMIRITARYFVDASGDIVLARKADCQVAFGHEGKEAYQEPCATEKSKNVNAVTYVFRIHPVQDNCHIDCIPNEYKRMKLDPWITEKMKSVISCFCMYPNGDINVNMLPTMEGNEYFALGEKADAIGKARVYAYWHYLQTEKNMQGYTLIRIFDAGVRESYRLVGKYVLSENDIRAGIKSQPKIGRTAAIADHPLDVHGKEGMCRELEIPYEIPIECTMTKEYDNLFVACRGASFSHIASASARLTRTMLSLGEGVGEYISRI